MIIQCGHCRLLYDAGGLESGTTVACRCGDILLIPDPDDLEGTQMIVNYVKRLADEEGVLLNPNADETRWEFQRGSARISLDYDQADGLFTIESVIMPVPVGESLRMALYQKVLELNYRSTGEARFAIVCGNVVVTFTRRLLGLDYVEFHSAIESVSCTADDYDDELRDKFMGRHDDADDEEIDLARMPAPRED